MYKRKKSYFTVGLKQIIIYILCDRKKTVAEKLMKQTSLKQCYFCVYQNY